MDEESARQAIRGQDAVLRSLLPQLRREAGELSDRLRPWQKRALTRRGRSRPEALQAVTEVRAWCRRNSALLHQWHVYFPPAFSNITGAAHPPLPPGGKQARAGVTGEMDALLDHLAHIQERCEIDVPILRDVRRSPPRDAKLKGPALARHVAEDLRTQVEAGRGLEERLLAGTARGSVVLEWGISTQRVLGAFSGEVLVGFRLLMDGADLCESRVVDSELLGRAYLALGLIYLEEVQERMPDYAEASGQQTPEPGVSLSISGGNFYGGQFAARIENIDSTIAGVVQQGGDDLAEALTALQQAVLNQADLGDSQREDLLDNVEYLAQAAQDSPESRNRGVLRSALSALSTAASAGEDINRVMQTWGHVLHGLLP